MFIFNDEFIANKQKEKTAELLEGLLVKFNIEHCPEIEYFFDNNVKSYEFLEELPGLAKTKDQLVRMLCVPSNSNVIDAIAELEVMYDKIIKSSKEPLPFIEFSFPSQYRCKHGERYKHVYIFFFTYFKNFNESRDSILHYLNKLNKLKVFL